jgi:hypothetical protein
MPAVKVHRVNCGKTLFSMLTSLNDGTFETASCINAASAWVIKEPRVTRPLFLAYVGIQRRPTLWQGHCGLDGTAAGRSRPGRVTTQRSGVALGRFHLARICEVSPTYDGFHQKCPSAKGLHSG